MDVLHYEIVNNNIFKTDTFIMTLLCLTALSLIAIGLYWLFQILTGLDDFNFTGLVILLIGLSLAYACYSIYVDNDYKYEIQKVIVSDWNEVYNEKWEIVEQEGDIVTIKRKLYLKK